MSIFTSVLCALDPVHDAARVLRHAVGFAGLCEARLTVLSVTRDDVRVAEARVRRQIAEAIPPGAYYPADVSVRVVKLALGQPIDSILDAAKDGVDLIVAGTHSTSGWSRWLLGSTSAALMMETTCPLLLVPPGQVEVVRLDGGRAVLVPGAVLVAVDPAEHNDRQLALASEMAALAGQSLVAMTAVVAGSDAAAAEQVLRTRTANAAPVAVSRYVVRAGAVAETIDLAAVDEHAGLVVMGLREQGARGEVAAAVLKTKDAVVLAVPPMVPAPPLV